jgi:S1-C subfamily serine protease
MRDLSKVRNSRSLAIMQATIILLVFVMLLAVAITVQQPVMAQQQPSQRQLSSSDSLPSSSLPSSSSSSSSLTNIFKRVEGSVVQVISTIELGNNSNLHIIINGNPITQNQTVLASGFVYDKQGHIVTNNHVISNASKVDITFVDGNTYSAKVIGKDPFSDIAVLQLTDSFLDEKLIPLIIANSSQLQVGQQVIAIGNPFGLSGSMTTGIVSQIGRLLPTADTPYSIPNGIQTDAAMNPGNSGGPLLNIQGQVVGMNIAIISSSGAYSGIGFAIPSNTIIREVPSLIKYGTFTHSWIGFAGGKITPDLAKAAGLQPNYKGVMVASVQPNSPAAKAGLKGLSNTSNGITHLGDIITAINRHRVRQMDDIINYIDSLFPGNNVNLTVNRSGKIIDLTANLQPRPVPEAGVSSPPPRPPPLSPP